MRSSTTLPSTSTIVKRPFEDIPDDEWSHVFDVNVKERGCVRAPSPPRCGDRARQDHERHHCSDGAAEFRPLRCVQGGDRRAARLARELGGDGICVNTLTPDYIAFDRDYDNRQPEMAAALAAQRIFDREQTPEDLVGALLFLVGPGSDFVTGQNIWVNGGRAFGRHVPTGEPVRTSDLSKRQPDAPPKRAPGQLNRRRLPCAWQW